MRVHFITGAASGIGAAVAQGLLDRGEAVAAADLRTEGLARLKAPEPTRLLSLALDVRQPQQWQAAVAQTLERFGRLDVLHNVAGVLRPGYAVETTPEDVDFHLDVNVKGVMFGVQAVLPSMRAQGAGQIINVASLAGLSPVPGLNLYCASKFAVRGYSLSIAAELKGQGIRVSVVCPDAVQTPMLDLQKDAPQAALTFSGGRSLTVAEVRDAILHTVLPKAPLELTLPRSRGLLARLSGGLPALTQPLLGVLSRRGRRQQARYSPSTR